MVRVRVGATRFVGEGSHRGIAEGVTRQEWETSSVHHCIEVLVELRGAERVRLSCVPVKVVQDIEIGM